MTPLAEILRPKSLDEYIGQQHLIGPGAVLRTLIDSGNIPSMIFWGPPGIGKTTLAMIISNTLNRPFHTLSAISSGVKEVREVINKAQEEEGSILFIDEIHRFNKAQQDSLLGAVERGIITLIGATTENPSFNLNNALLSRCHIGVLEPLNTTDLLVLVDRAEKYLGKKIPLNDDARKHLAEISDGDARFLLNTVEYLISAKFKKKLGPDDLDSVIQKRAPLSDKSGDEHYNMISAVHKSLRASDTDAALYWVARMMTAGQDPMYIFRRLTRFAMEDIGLADPNAMQMALAAWQIYERMGSPEGDLALTELVIYLGTAPKSVSAYRAQGASYRVARETSNLMPPKNFLNAPTKMMQNLGYGKNYVYDPDTESGCSGQNCFPESMPRQSFYQPLERGFEREIKKRFEYWNALRIRANKPSE